MKVFISYRRADTQDFCGRLAARLRDEPAIDEVFIDVDGIDAGANYLERLKQALAKSDVIIVVIGPHWVTPRLFEADDAVRMEVREALASGRRALPVLANGAEMPSPDQVPPELAELPFLNAVPIRYAAFDRDADYLIDRLVKRRKPGAFGAYLNRHPGQAAMLRGLLGLAVGAAALLLGLVVLFETTGLSLGQVLVNASGQVWSDPVGPVIAFVATWLVISALTPALLGGPRRRRRRA